MRFSLFMIAATAAAILIPQMMQPKGLSTQPFPGLSSEVKKPEVIGNKDINISIVKRDVLTPEEATLFKSLYFQNQVTSFSFSEDGDISEDCYDDRLPVSIIIHKGDKAQESDKEFVDQLRQMNCNVKDYAVIEEDTLFGYDRDSVTEQDAINIQSLKNKVVRNSVSFLDHYNDLVYVVNGTELESVS